MGTTRAPTRRIKNAPRHRDRRRALRVLFLDPFHGGSHRAFARGWAERSRHRIRVLQLPPRFWKWRLRGAAFTFAEMVQAKEGPWDLIVATSLMNAADFMAASRLTAPLVVYFHENQLSYPRPAAEPLDHGLALASLSSAAAARAVVFNSEFHRREFFGSLKAWMAMFPELAPARTARAIARRSRVITPGIDWEGLAPLAYLERDGEGGPLILWNHRWEFDKNPAAFFAAMTLLARRGWSYRLALLGENSQFVPKPFLEAQQRLGARVVRFGYVKTSGAYRRWLGKSDIVVSTAHHENFGISVAEAVAAGAFPLVPARLSYPELLPAAIHRESLYRDQADLVARLERQLARPDRIRNGRRARSLLMRRYDWSLVAPRLDALVDEVAASYSALGEPLG